MSLVWKYRRGKNWYLAYAQDVGRPVRSLKISNERVAEAIRAKEENDLLLGKYGIKYRPRQAIRYSDFVQLCLQRKRSQGRSPATIAALGYALNNFGESLCRDEFVHKIPPIAVERFIASRYDAGRKAKTIWNEIVALKNAFRWAAKEGFAGEDITENIELPRRSKSAPDYLHEDEYLALLAKFPGDPFLDVLNFYILTGCRRDEGRQIRPSRHVDWKRRVLTIPQPKQSNFRMLPISSELEPVLRRLITAAKPMDAVIPYENDHLTKRMKRMFEETGLRSSLHFHSLRHTFGTWLGGQGAGQKNLQFLMGHSDAASTNVYVHGMESALRRDIDQLKLPKPKKKRKKNHLHIAYSKNAKMPLRRVGP